MKTPRKPDTSPAEEFVPEDDAIIGHAFKWSALVVASIAVLVVVVLLIVNRETPADEHTVETDMPTVNPFVSGTLDMPEVHFTDITVDAGIDFDHYNGATGEKLLPETMGGGNAFFDYDNDGDPDLLFVNGMDWPHIDTTARPTLKLYRNSGGGRFADVTAEVGLDVTLYGMGASIADYDGDGDRDLFITAVGPNRMFRNDGGTFTDVTAAAGVAGAAEAWSSGAGFFDADADGDLDLFVCNYIEWSKEIDLAVNFKLEGVGRAYGPPTSFGGTQPYLYRNMGDGTFTEVGQDSGLHVLSTTGTPVAKSLAVTFVDIDGDGDQDILVANDTTQNFAYRNEGNGTFTEKGESIGFAYDPMGSATGAMGIDSAYYLNDDAMAVAIGNFANETTSFFVSQGEGGFFADESISAGIGSPSRVKLSFGLVFFDYDLDGRLDLLAANGHLEEEINKVQASQHFEQPAQLFWNAGIDSRRPLELVADETVGDLANPIVGRGAAFADIDSDGDLDVLLTQTGGRPLLLRNEQSLGHHWLRVELKGKAPNRDAIGAWVDLTAGGVTQRRQVMPFRSYLSQVELPITFGLGENDRVDALTVIWPDGTRQDVQPEFIDNLLVVEQR
jgi:hypothetical protein